MADTIIHDVTWQFKQDVSNDIAIRTLNASLTTALWLKNPVSRHIVQPFSPLEIIAYWDKPKFTFDDDMIEINVELNGGARQALTGHILTIEGEVSAQKACMLDVDEEGRPFVHTQCPTPSEISLNELQAVYKGGRFAQLLEMLGDNPLSDRLAQFDPSKELTLLRPLLSIGILEPLADIPLTYTLRSLPLTEQIVARARIFAYDDLCICRGKDPDSIGLGFMLNASSSRPLGFSSLLPEKSKYNAALRISPQGLNTLLERLCADGQARGNMKHTQWGWINWEWEGLICTFLQNAVQITGVLLSQGKREVIDTVEISCKLDRKGRLRCALLSPQSDANRAELILEAWSVVLHSFFSAQDAHTTSRKACAEKKLIQCFEIPCTKITVEAVARRLQIGNDQLIIFYTIPLSLTGFQAEIPLPKPTVVVKQLIIPRQTGPGTPVTIQLQAKIVKPSSPPYDYAWTTGLLSEPQDQHTAIFSITAYPTQPAVGKGPQNLKNVTLKVIDMFGQVTEVHTLAKYFPYQQSKIQQPKTVPPPIPLPVHNTRKGGQGCGWGGGGIVLLLLIRLLVALLGGQSYTIQTTIGSEAFLISVHSGNACMSRDNGQANTMRGYFYPGYPRLSPTFQSVFQCTGTYQNNYLNFAETVVSDTLISGVGNQYCTANSQYTFVQFIGTASDGRISGTYYWHFPSWNCNDGEDLRTSLNIYFRDHSIPINMDYGGQGNGYWSGTVSNL